MIPDLESRGYFAQLNRFRIEEVQFFRQENGWEEWVLGTEHSGNLRFANQPFTSPKTNMTRETWQGKITMFIHVL